MPACLVNQFFILVLQVRKTWCNDALNKGEDFRNVIFADESTVEMSSRRLFFHQPSSLIQKICARRPKPMHIRSVHKSNFLKFNPCLMLFCIQFRQTL